MKIMCTINSKKGQILQNCLFLLTGAVVAARLGHGDLVVLNEFFSRDGVLVVV